MSIIVKNDLTRRSFIGSGIGLCAVPACSAAGSNSAMNVDVLKRVRADLERQVHAGFAPGVVGLIARGDEVHVMPIGRMAASGPPMRRDTIFRIASMTKPITAVAVMMLVEEGKLRLDERVDRLLPELAGRRVLKSLDGPIDDTVPARRPITVEDLLTFRLGWGILLKPPGTYPVQKRVADLGMVGFGPPDPGVPYDGHEWMRRLGTLPLFAQPGEQWMYDTGSVLQGVLVARASGLTLGQFFAARIFGPLGMADSGFHVPQQKMDRFATAYHAQNGGLIVRDKPATGKWARPPLFEQGDAGLVSTAGDYLSFVRMLLAGGSFRGKRLLSPASVKAMITNKLTIEQRVGGVMILGKGAGWGYGMSVMVESALGAAPPGSISWFGGSGTIWRSDPERDFTAILLTQREFESPEPAPIFKAFESGAYRASDS